MTDSVAPEIADRIRRPIPPGLGVLPGSLPVTAFGDVSAAAVATIALNPSWLEFQSPMGSWLAGDERRLASLVSLGAHDPRDLDDYQVACVLAESNAYFRGPDPHMDQFHWLEALLRSSGAGSYASGTACHLDLVQWATKPVQRALPPGAWQALVEADRDFLRWQLHHGNVKVALVDGAFVLQGVADAKLVDRWHRGELEYGADQGSGRFRVYYAFAAGIIFLGWNMPLGGPIPAADRAALNQWVSRNLPLARPPRGRLRLESPVLLLYLSVQVRGRGYGAATAVAAVYPGDGR
ncbi:MAG TPA: hypothetical protein VK817_04320 [Trebonia sp.]|nr:hypothetical protein [Trebonia sp.]